MSIGVVSWLVGVIVAVALLATSFWWWHGYMSIAEIGEYNVLSPGDAELDEASSTVRGGIPIAAATVHNSSVLSLIRMLPNGGTFEAFLDASGVAKEISGRGPYTVFVATDSAFSHLPSGALSAMTLEEMKRIVEFHIVADQALDLTVTATSSVVALSKDVIPITENIADHAAQVGSGWALQEFKTDNGNVYTISAVLLPPSKIQ